MGINWSGDNWRDAEITLNLDAVINSIYQGRGGPTFLVLGFVLGMILSNVGVFTDYLTNSWTELLGIGVTIVVIERLAARRADADRKKLLFAQLKSTESVVAMLAFEELKLRGWIAEMDKENWRGVQLPNANMIDFDLSGADLGDANLSGTTLRHGKLSGANLGFANLSGATLRDANLSGARLVGANLSGAFLERANLTGADLWGVNLSSANLGRANLRDARHLDRATFDENTTLPDSSTFTPDTDLTRFTSGAWQPDEGTLTYRHWKNKGWLTPPDDEA